MSDTAFPTFESLVIEQRGHVAEVTLSRPDLFNRFDDVGHHEFVDACLALRRRPDVRAILLAAQGRVFSAGGDFDMVLAANADLPARSMSIDIGQQLLAALIDLPQPIVTALQGHAIGLGANIVLATDYIVSHPTAKLSDPHVLLGLVAGDGGCLVWPASIGMTRAKKHLLTGEPITADVAHQIGLITDLVDTPDDVLPAARKVVDHLAGLAPIAVQGTKRALNNVLRHRYQEVIPLSFAYELHTLGTQDLRAAVEAQRTKSDTSPVFENR